MYSLISKIVEFGVRIRNRKYENGKNVVHSRLPVISVGNLSFGGTGKTPFVIMLADILMKMSRHPVIIGRGFNRQVKGNTIVSDGKQLLADISSAGDEMLMVAQSIPVPVLSCDSKSDAALEAEKLFNVDTIIVDDAFQHRKLHRNLDIVLIDRETIDNPYLFPKGRLREPLSSLERADIICFNGDFQIDETSSEFYPEKFKLKLEKKVLSINNLLNCIIYLPDKFPFIDYRFIAISGIAKPVNFILTLKSINFEISQHKIFADHYNYSRDDVRKIIDLCKDIRIKNIITTEKDAVKLANFKELFMSAGLNCFYIKIGLKIESGNEKFMEKLSRIFN
ncbi:MAG: tetraacyldisaccharide 4'-kinase [Ignavibacteria bacterium]|nr:tetraacyldisaccharide 4'-kinase [Ignavibacteria bacterium]